MTTTSGQEETVDHAPNRRPIDTQRTNHIVHTKRAATAITESIDGVIRGLGRIRLTIESKVVITTEKETDELLIVKNFYLSQLIQFKFVNYV